MRYIKIYNNSGDVQTALNEESLAKPYVAYITGEDRVDFNELSPVVPCFMGEWSEDGEGHYTFLVDTNNTGWEENPIKIGELLGVSADGNIGDLDIMLNYDTTNSWWHMEFYNDLYSNCPNHDFSGVDIWFTGTQVDSEESGSEIGVEYDGNGSFIFSRGDFEAINMNTINPECE